MHQRHLNANSFSVCVLILMFALYCSTRVRWTSTVHPTFSTTCHYGWMKHDKTIFLGSAAWTFGILEDLCFWNSSDASRNFKDRLGEKRTAVSMTVTSKL